MGMIGLRDVFVVAPAYHHHLHHHHHQDAATGGLSGSDQINSSAAAALGVPQTQTQTQTQHLNVEDTDINFLSRSNSKVAGVHVYQPHQTHYLHFKSGGSSSNSGSGSGTATCQDCGNQAKKECSHRRCRTCCKSRGFDCSTHVKSTWVSAARRRERQVMTTGNPTAGSSVSTSSGTKKPRIIGSQQQATSHTSTSNTPPQSFDTSSSRQDPAWPGQVRAAAVFKCVRVTAVEDGDDEYAYQAVVKIGGHVFKGFLYDQGVESKEGFPNMSDLHLGGGGHRNSHNHNHNHNGASGSPPILDPPDVYGGASGGGGGFLGNSAYGYNQNENKL